MASTSLALIAVFLVGFTFVVIGLQIARGDKEDEEPSVEPLRPRLSEMAPGEAPSTALPVSGEGSLQRTLSMIRCACGTAGSGSEARHTPMRLDGRPLTSVRWSCEKCGAERTVYFELRAAG